MKISIFGSNGYIGQHLVTRLSSERCQIDQYSSQENCIFDADSGVIKEQVLDRTSGTDAVIYLSQSPYYRQLPKHFEHVWGVNVISAVKAAEWARSNSAKKFIYASTGNVYCPGFEQHGEEDRLRQDDWYALSKIHAEQALSFFKNDMSVTNIRLFGVYGPGQKDRLIPKLIDSVVNGREIHIHGKNNRVDEYNGLCLSVCYIDDIVDIIFRLLQADAPYIINLSSKQVVSIREISDKIGELINKKPEYLISDTPRNFDLIADVTRLVELINPQFTDFTTGLSRVMDKYLSSGVSNGS